MKQNVFADTYAILKPSSTYMQFNKFYRFMPDGMYLNARYLGVEQLAKLIMEIINDDTPKYQDFFRWQQFYSYHDVTVDDEHHDGICDLCTLANNKTRRPANNLIRFWNVKS